MGSEYTITEVLEFCKVRRTRAELIRKFNLSNTQSFRLVRWLKKGKYIEEIKLPIEGKQNWAWYFKTKKEL